MTKDQARADGFCDFCAALCFDKQLCGVLSEEKTICQLDIETQERWRKTYRLPAGGRKKERRRSCQSQ